MRPFLRLSRAIAVAGAEAAQSTLLRRWMAWSGDLTTRRGAVFLDELALD
jgi:hypothetical protein